MLNNYTHPAGRHFFKTFIHSCRYAFIPKYNYKAISKKIVLSFYQFDPAYFYKYLPAKFFQLPISDLCPPTSDFQLPCKLPYSKPLYDDGKHYYHISDQNKFIAVHRLWQRKREGNRNAAP